MRKPQDWKIKRYRQGLMRDKEVNGRYTEEIRLRLDPRTKAELDAMAYPEPLAGWLREKVVTKIIGEDGG